MNLKLSETEVRFRINKDEFDMLLNTGKITCHTTFPGGSEFTYHVGLLAKGEGPVFDFSGQKFDLFLNRETVENFAKTLPAKKGLLSEFVMDDDGQFSVLLEVDVRKSHNGKH